MDDEQMEDMMKDKILEIKNQANLDLDNSNDLKDIEQVRIKYLGKKGMLTAVLKEMGKLSKEERPIIGSLANEVRTGIEEKIKEKTGKLQTKKLYLDPYMDMYNLEIISYVLSDRPNGVTMLQGLEVAIERTKVCPYRRTFHFDRGWGYQMNAYQAML